MNRDMAEPHKKKDWSLNLEDPYFEEHPEELMDDAMEAVEKTEAGCYVNLVTPSALGDPHEWLIPELQKRIAQKGQPVDRIVFVDQCGCGGYVTRVYK